MFASPLLEVSRLFGAIRTMITGVFLPRFCVLFLLVMGKCLRCQMHVCALQTKQAHSSHRIPRETLVQEIYVNRIQAPHTIPGFLDTNVNISDSIVALMCYI
jgi:hypothetical protein